MTDGSPTSVVFPADGTDTNTIVSGPALSGKDRLAMEAVSGALTADQVPIVVTTSDTAEQFRTRLGPLLPAGRSPDETLVVDASDVAQSQGVTDGWTITIGSPSDLTGIGIALSKGFDRLDEMGAESPYILVDNLTTLLIYADFDRVFRFVDDLNRRAAGSDRSVIAVLDDDAIDEQTHQRLVQLFSRGIEVETDDGTTRFRRRGRSSSDWHDYDTDGGVP